MRRIVIAGTALVVLGVSATAAAASTYNNYSGSQLSISAGNKAPLSMVEKLQASAPSGSRAAPLTNIKLTIYGVKLDVGKLPVCSDSQILSNKTRPLGGCSKASLIGSGPVHAILGPATDSSSGGTPCNPYLNVFNGGPNKQVFYFYTKSANDCGGLTTGATAPFDGTIEINCQLHGPSTQPSPGTSEGIKVNTRGVNFNKHVNGDNVFIQT